MWMCGCVDVYIHTYKNTYIHTYIQYIYVCTHIPDKNTNKEVLFQVWHLHALCESVLLTWCIAVI